MIDVLMLPGTGFPTGGDGVCEEFARHLDPARFTSRIVEYPAAYGGIGLDEPYADSRAAGRQALFDAIKAAPGRVVIAGYSQGAQIAGDLAAEIDVNGNLAGVGVDEVLAAALIADPGRPLGGGMPGRPIASGYGITGVRPIKGLAAYWAANEGDPITALPEGNPLRSIADATEYFSLRSPADAERWALNLIDRAKSGQWQRWWALENWRTWGGAIAYARGYLRDGRHTDDYILRGLAAELAETINRAVS